MSQVFKIKYGCTLRRISVPRSHIGVSFTYGHMEQKMRDFFQIPRTFGIIFTYRDVEDEIVTMVDTGDFKDACLLQGLNPLRLDIKTVLLQTEIESKGNESGLNTTEFDVGALLKGLFPHSTAKAIDQVLSRYPPCLFTTVPAHVLPAALDTFLGTLAAGNTENTTNLQRGDQISAPSIAVHKYIECDNCYVCPIVGPRYKSITKHDYDLCSNCFKKVGNATEYRKLDRPSIAVHPNLDASVKGAFDQSSSGCNHRLLDAEFVKDVTIMDGSKVEVGSTFTKVWRLRNCGALPWPQHTKLVHVGGIMLGLTGFVTLKLPEGGLPSKSELDVSVELKAPNCTGQYVDKWRLRAPSGQMFGHSVWVLIDAVPVCNKSQTRESEEPHIDKKRKDSIFEEAKKGESFLIGENRGEEGNEADLGPMEVGLETASISQKLKEQCGETDGFSLVENVDKGIGEGYEAPEEFELVGSLPQDFPSGELCSKESDANVESHENSFAEDNSLTSAEWDPMLKELEELGFHDTQADIEELLLKSEGSIKRAVKELAELENLASGKIKAA